MTNASIVELKHRYLEMIEGEGCLNEIMFDKPEWDDDPDQYSIAYHGADRLVAMVPDAVITNNFECQ